MSELVRRARDFAHYAHSFIAQRRKYSEEPYWTHTDAIAELVCQYGGSLEMIAAANLHDILEDVTPKVPFCNNHLLRINFGVEVEQLVIGLTDVYTPDKYPDLNREKRKKLEALRLGACDKQVKIIKLADIAHNTKSIVKHDPGFAKKYLEEKEYLLSLIKVDHPLYNLALGNIGYDYIQV